MHHLIDDLDSLTRQLEAADESDLSVVARLIEQRSAVLMSIARSTPGSLTQPDLASLRAVAERGVAAIEKFVLLRRRMAAEWHRLNQLRDSNARTVVGSVSVKA